MADNAPKDTSLQSTKQMLDELDALMARMLSLPVNEMDGVPPLPAEPTSGPNLAASLTLLNQPADAPAQAKSTPTKASPTVATIAPPPAKKPIERRPKSKLAHPPIKPPHRHAPAAKKSDGSPSSATLAYSTSEPERLTNEVVPTTVASDLDPLLERASGLSGRRGGLLTWINQHFDRWTLFLGPLGRPLRSQEGRALLGLTGIILLTIAIGWLLKDWLGWQW